MPSIKPVAEALNWIDGANVSDTILHIHGGMAVLLLARLLTRRSLATPIPLLFVYAAGLMKEFLDYQQDGYIKGDSLADVINTVLWPTVLFIGLRVRRARGA